MADVAPDKGHVRIILKEDISDGLAERNIILNRQDPFIAVGRASKAHNKGFLAAADNCWFDSPVMSRRHAEIAADFDEKTVTITDVGSLHGTFVNGRKIESYRPRTLNNSDSIQFGIPIWRAMENFHPKTVMTTFKFDVITIDSDDGDQHTATTFQVPDESEDGSEMDEDYSSDDHNPGASRTDTTMTMSLPAPASTIIDLTQADNRPEPEVISLDSPPTSLIQVIKNTIVLDASDVTCGPAPSSPELVSANRAAQWPLAFDKCVSAAADTVDDEDGNDEGQGYESEPGFTDSHDSDLDSHESDLDSHVDYPDEDYSDKDVDPYLSDAERRPYHESDLDEGSDSDGQLSDDADEDDVDSLSCDSSLDYENNDKGCERELSEAAAEAPRDLAEAAAAMVRFSSADDMAAHDKVKKSISIKRLLNDQPESPMLVSIDSPYHGSAVFEQTLNHTSVGHGIGLNVNSDKSKFFEARQQNKAVANHLRAVQPLPEDFSVGSSHSKTGLFAPKCHSPENTGPIQPELALEESLQVPAVVSVLAQPCSGSSAGPMSTPLARPQEPENEVPLPQWTQQTSKELQACSTTSQETPTATQPVPEATASCEPARQSPLDCNSRHTHGLSISEMLNVVQQNNPAGKLKRKADEISTEEAAVDQIVVNKADVSSAAADNEDSMQIDSDGSSPTVPAKVSQPSERPIKKPRTIGLARRLGMAALGSVGAGALLMGTLIYTSPTFA